jgi:hypothetical protein
VAELTRAVPGLAVTPVPETDATALVTGTVDARVSYGEADASSDALLDDPWVVLVGSSSPLAVGTARVAPDALATIALVVPRSAAARAVLVAALAAIGVAPPLVVVAVAVDDVTTVHALVAAGVGGGSVLPWSAVDARHPGTVALGLDHLLAPRPLRLWWRDATPALQALRHAARSTCDPLGRMSSQDAMR